MAGRLKIGELARRAGVTAKAIRFYTADTAWRRGPRPAGGRRSLAAWNRQPQKRAPV